MFSWGGVLIKLIVSVAISFGTMKTQSVGTQIFFAVLMYGILSAWWYCCALMGNYLIGSVLFVAAVFFSSWGVSAAPNMVVKVLAYVVLIAIFLGGIISDIAGMIRSIRG